MPSLLRIAGACAAFFTLARAQFGNIQINYYSDSSCTQFVGDVNVTWATDTNNCYNYNYGTSMNMANCNPPESFSSCVCNVFYEQNCEGAYRVLDSVEPGNNCLENGSQLNSYYCYNA
jgi:hypothetical protein